MDCANNFSTLGGDHNTRKWREQMKGGEDNWEAIIETGGEECGEGRGRRRGQPVGG